MKVFVAKVSLTVGRFCLLCDMLGDLYCIPAPLERFRRHFQLKSRDMKATVFCGLATCLVSESEIQQLRLFFVRRDPYK